MFPACRPPSPRVSHGAALCPCQQPHPSRLRGCLLWIADHHIVCFLIWSATCIVARHRTAVRLGSSTSTTAACRLQQGRLVKRQAAKEKLRKLVAPLFTSPPGGPSGVQAMGAVRPRISVSFEGLSVALQDGTPVLNGVTGRFSHSKVGFWSDEMDL